MKNKDLKYWIWLNTLPNVGIKTTSFLIKQFDTPEDIWKQKESTIEKLNISEKAKENLKNKSYKNGVEKYIEKLIKNNIKVYQKDDENYPNQLKDIEDAPFLIYQKGNLEIKGNKYIAIVGSRKPTYYGIQVGRELARALSIKGYIIVSGMASGIDTASHLGALDVRKPTISVWGTGLDTIYPSSNKELSNKIIENGAIITEFPLGMPPRKENFPMRNRIISGLSLGVVVVEARQKSGTLITVEHAIEQGKDVFAVPGPINSRESFGSNHLIKEGAKLVTKAEDIIEEYEGITNKFEDIEQEPLIKEYDETFLTKEEKEVFYYIGTTPIQLEEIILNFNQKVNNINSTLTMLEMKGYIAHLSGNYFIRK